MKRRGVLLVLSLGGACIIPDRGIEFEGGPGNPGAVRILEPAPAPAAWGQWCLDREVDITLKNRDIETGTEAFCPSVRDTRPGGIVDDGTFCICPQGQRDMNAPASWSIYAEDPDMDGDEPEDRLYGVLLLDPDTAGDAESKVAYQNYLEGCSRGEDTEATDVSKVFGDNGERMYLYRVIPPIARNPFPQWEFVVDDAVHDTVDLCNDNNGEQLDPGLYNLQFMVTDRPFFSASRDDLEREQCGVPDLSSGATYAVTNYIFECIDGRLEENQDDCNCEESE